MSVAMAADHSSFGHRGQDRLARARLQAAGARFAGACLQATDGISAQRGSASVK
jgi:hypothetical protein